MQGYFYARRIYHNNMIDIATATPLLAKTSHTSIPFDWCLLDTGKSLERVWHDSSNLCAGVKQCAGPASREYGLVMEATMHTAVIHSLFTDARAGNDDKLPMNQTDRRGWLGAFYVPKNGTKAVTDYGSRLWIIYNSHASSEGEGTDNVLEFARFAAYESLLWLVDEGIVDTVVVTSEWRGALGTLLALNVQMFKGNVNKPIYNALWGTTLERTQQSHDS